MSYDVQAEAEYLAEELGWHVFPVANKKPLVQWSVETAYSAEGVRGFDWSQATHVGVACGPSGLCVLDIDDLSQVDALKALGFHHNTLTQRTPRGGLHLIYKATNKQRNTAGAPLPGVDIRGDGGFIVWYGVDDGTEIEPWPVSTVIRAAAEKAEKPTADPLGAVVVGNRNSALASHLGGIVKRLPQVEVADLIDLGRAFNLRLADPLPDAEVVTVAASISRYREAPQEPEELSHLVMPFSAIPYQEAPKSLCGTWLREGTYNTVHGKPGGGKTAFCGDLVACMKSGRPFLGMATQDPGAVLWVNGDMPLWQVNERLSALRQFPDVHLAHLEMMDLMCNQDKAMELIRRYKFVVFDNRGSLFHLREVNTEEAWAPFLRLMHRITSAGVTVLMQSHSNKSQEFSSAAGSGAQDRTSTAGLRITSREQDGVRVRTVDFEKNRMGTEHRFDYQLIANESGGLECVLMGHEQPRAEPIDQVRVSIIGILSGRKVKGEVDPVSKSLLVEAVRSDMHSRGIQLAERTITDRAEKVLQALITDGSVEKSFVNRSACYKWA
jgi:hypothetical protein